MARDFDGTDDQLDVADANIWHSETAYTWLGHFWTDNNGINMTGFSKGNYGSDWSYILQFINGDASGGIRCFIASAINDPGNNYGDTAGSLIANGTWYHFAVVYNGAGAANADRLKVYLDTSISPGAATERSLTFGGTIASSLANSSTAFRVGTITGLGRFLNGRAADNRVYTAALTAEEIGQARRGALPRHDKVILWLPLFGTVSPEPDWSGANRHATVTGAVRIDHPPGISADWLRPQIKRATVAIAAPPGGATFPSWNWGGGGW